MLETRRLLLGVRCRFRHGYFADPVDAIRGARKARGEMAGAARTRGAGFREAYSPQRPGVLEALPGRALSLVETVGLLAGDAAVEAQVGGTAPSGPRLAASNSAFPTPESDAGG